ncbi:hypothetical protein BHM03_00058129 [Ensete ventricosum]|nr:hypothetical protein BHM03_00058129 [Ensete ventricosum]
MLLTARTATQAAACRGETTNKALSYRLPTLFIIETGSEMGRKGTARHGDAQRKVRDEDVRGGMGIGRVVGRRQEWVINVLLLQKRQQTSTGGGEPCTKLSRSEARLPRGKYKNKSSDGGDEKLPIAATKVGGKWRRRSVGRH